jgi:DNA-binding transcriptional MerR regulator
MEEKLRIGEVAELFDVSTKTIRHYEKIGLIRPQRAENDYRQFGPEDVLRLQRIRRLQALGLSLKQIGLILQHQDDAQLWEEVLRALQEEVAADIELLRARKQQIERLLAEGLPPQTEEILPPSDRVNEYLEQYLPQVRAQLWRREKAVYAFLGDLFAGRLPPAPHVSPSIGQHEGRHALPGGNGHHPRLQPLGIAWPYHEEEVV